MQLWDENYRFVSAEHALAWSSMVQRRQSTAISSIYDKGLFIDEAGLSEKSRRYQESILPTTPEEVRLMAAKLASLLKKLPEDEEQLLILKYYGDWHSMGNLQAMIVMQDRMKRDGKTLRLSSRYSVRQIAAKVNQNYRTVHRKIQKVEQAFEQLLSEEDLLLREETHVA